MSNHQNQSVISVPFARVGAFQGRSGCSPSFQAEQISPYVQAFVLLQGEQQFLLDGLPFSIEASGRERSEPVAGIFCVQRPCSLTFLTEGDNTMRKVRVSAPISWISALAGDQGTSLPELARFFSGHLSRHFFKPYPYLIQLAEQILDPPPMLQGELLTLYRQSHGLEILSHICRSLIDSEGETCHRATVSALRQSTRAHDYILENLRGDLTIETVARAAGTAAGALQRSFKEHYGQTVVEFIRQRRLEAARDALERGGLSIAQAAYIAGYAHHSNFTTAFKRAYGVTPSLRRR